MYKLNTLTITQWKDQLCVFNHSNLIGYIVVILNETELNFLIATYSPLNIILLPIIWIGPWALLMDLKPRYGTMGSKISDFYPSINIFSAVKYSHDPLEYIDESNNHITLDRKYWCLTRNPAIKPEGSCSEYTNLLVIIKLNILRTLYPNLGNISRITQEIIDRTYFTKNSGRIL